LGFKFENGVWELARKWDMERKFPGWGFFEAARKSARSYQNDDRGFTQGGLSR
jgi:hypothetical protein